MPPSAKERETMSQMLSTKEAAAEIGTDARTLRKFIRSDSCSFDAVGQGKRYEFSKKDVNQLKKAFLAWSGGAPSKKNKAMEQAEAARAKGHEHDGEEFEPDALVEDDNNEPAEVEWTDDAEADLDAIEGPSDEDLDDIEIQDIDLD